MKETTPPDLIQCSLQYAQNAQISKCIIIYNM